MEEFIAHFFFVAHISQVMSVCEKNDNINTHIIAQQHNIDLGVNNAIVGHIAREAIGWKRVCIAPTNYGLRKAV
jgi:hypothetical protein